MRPERGTRPASGRLIGGKFDFYGDERRGISVAVYPQLEFAPAHGAEKGLSEAGQTIVLPLLVAREFHAFTFVFNGELEYANIGHSVFSDDGGHFYAGGGFKVVIGR